MTKLDDVVFCDYCGARLFRPCRSCCTLFFCKPCWEEHVKTLHPTGDKDA